MVIGESVLLKDGKLDKVVIVSDVDFKGFLPDGVLVPADVSLGACFPQTFLISVHHFELYVGVHLSCNVGIYGNHCVLNS